MRNKKLHKYLAWLLALAIVFSMGSIGNPAEAMAKSKKTAVVKSVSLKIGNKKVTKKTYKMKRGGKKKIKAGVSPKKGKTTIKFSTSNKKVVTVSKNGRVTAKKAGTAKITVTVRVKKAGKSSGTAKKKTWVKIKVTNPSSDKKDDTTEPPATENPSGKKSIVAYFSCTNNTKTIAEYVAESAGADIYRIEPSVPYTSADLDYNNAGSRTSKEQNDVAARPAIAGSLPSLDNYEVVYLGYPIWWGQAPKIMYTFIESYDLSGKVVVPFCTSGSSGIGTSASNLQAAARGNATWIAGQRFSGSSTKATVEQWVRGLDLSVGTSTVPTPAAPTQPPIVPTPLPTESPDVTQTLSPTESPDVTQTPSPTETPGSVQTPDITQAPDITQSPDITQTPENTQTPDVTQTPDITQTPGITQPPTETDSPSPTPTDTPDISGNRKSVVMYFSCTNNTKTIAEYVAESAEADIYRIEPSVPYTAADLNYNNADSRSIKEQNDAAARPAIAGSLPNLDNYEVVYLGYPIWSGQAPKIMYTFIESYDLSGKIVVPFCTSGGSGIGASAANLQAVSRGNATWTAGQKFSGSSTKATVEQWVRGLDLPSPSPTPTPTDTPDTSGKRKNVVVYFSCTDNTKTIAEYVAESTDADIYRIEPSVPYTSEDLNYGNSDSRATKEQNDSSARPEIAGELPDLEQYENVYLGYPIWWGQAPKIIYTFIEHYNLSGKTVIPFCTSASSGIGTSATNLQAVDTSQAVWLDGRRFSGSSPKPDVENWLAGLGLQ